MNTTQLIWNGCDGYTETSNLRESDRRFETHADGTATLWTRDSEHTSFAAIQIAEKDVPIVDGEPDYDGLFVTEIGNIYRAR